MYAASHGVHRHILLVQGLSVSLCNRTAWVGIYLPKCLSMYTVANILGQHGFSRLSTVHAFMWLICFGQAYNSWCVLAVHETERAAKLVPVLWCKHSVKLMLSWGDGCLPCTFASDNLRCIHENTFQVQAVILFAIVLQGFCQESQRPNCNRNPMLPLQMLHLLFAGPAFCRTCCLMKYWTNTVPKIRLEKG